MIKRIINKIKRMMNPPAPVEASGWFGNYASWQQVMAACTGYDAASILDTVKASVLKVKRGEAVYERDSVLFDKIQLSEPLLHAFLNSVSQNALHVVDFGGSLGSSYFQHRQALSHIGDLRWAVVEQSHFVDAGKKDIAGEHLQFYDTIHDALKSCNRQVLFVSSVIQYFEKPYELIEELMSYGFEYIIIDRTAFIAGHPERITRQVVPSFIYKASYPAWFLDEGKFKQVFLTKYDLLDSFDSAFDPKDHLEDGAAVYRKGFYFKRK